MPGPLGRPLLAWDVDDVLNDLLEEWAAALPRLPDAPPVRMTQNPPHELVGLDLSQYLASLDAFRLERFAGLSPRADVLDFLERHGDRFEHVALTAVPLRAADLSAGWTMRHFGRWVRGFHVVPSARDDDPQGRSATKAEFLRWFGRIDSLVDDSEGNVEAARAVGVRALLFPRPWNGARGDQTAALASLLSLTA